MNINTLHKLESAAVALCLMGIGAALLGKLADSTSIEFVYRVCAFLPAIGLLTAFLPNVEKHPAHAHSSNVS